MIRFFARHPTAANLLMAVFIYLGISSLTSLMRETFPDITPAQVQVTIVYPGASSEEIESSIAQRIEDAVEGVRYVKETISDCREGVANVTIEMEEGGDFIIFKDDITTVVEAITEFPNDAEEPTIKELGTTDPVISVLVSGDMTVVDLKAYCEQLKDRMLRLPAVSLVDVTGYSDHQLRVELSSEALGRFGLSVKNVADTVASQSTDIPAGGIETNQQDMLLRFVEQRRTPRELEELVIVGGRSGAEILLGDIGRVVDVFEADEQKTLIRDQRAGLLLIRKTKSEDVIRVASAVKEFLIGEREKNPKVNLTVSEDRSKLVSDRLRLLLKNGWQGMFLVFLTLWLFFNWRLSFWVAMSLPVSFLGGLYLMPFFGLTVNMMTMVGMLLALGILMDDGIVIAENIAAHRSRGKSAMQSAVDGVSEVAGGVLSSFVTTVCVLGPLAFISGNIGAVLSVIPIMLILVISVSLIEAFMILPAHLGHSMSHVDPDNSTRFRGWVDKGVELLRENVFGKFIDVAMRFRYLTIGCAIAAFLASISLMAGGILGFQPFPDLEGDVVVARLTLPAGTPLKRTEEIVERMAASLDQINAVYKPNQPDEQDLVTSYKIEFNVNAEAFETGPHVATVTADLLSAEIRNTRIDDIIAVWKRKIGDPADVISLSISAGSFGPAGRPIEVRLQGNDLQELKKASTETIAWFNQFKGVRNVADDLRRGKNEIRISLREGAFGLGLNTTSMANQVRAAFQGITVDEVQVGDESYEIDVRLSRDAQDDLADLDYFQFTLADGKQVPLETVARIEETRGWSRIARVDGHRTVTVRGDADSRVVSGSGLVSRFQKDVAPELEKTYSGLSINFEGATKESQETAFSIFTAAGTGLVGVFVLLSFQFRSYLEPLVVMSAIPLALVGVLWGHFLLGIDMSMPSALGFVSLAGIVINDSILLVLFLKQAIKDGQDPHESATTASRKRFRAIMLTSLTTVAGLLPLLFETSLQAQVLIPLAVSIAFGIMASTVLVLVVIPCIYGILADLGLLGHGDTQ